MKRGKNRRTKISIDIKDILGNELFLGDTLFMRYQRGGGTVIPNFQRKHDGFYWLEGIIKIEGGQIIHSLADGLMDFLVKPQGQEKFDTWPVLGGTVFMADTGGYKNNLPKELKVALIYGYPKIFKEVKK